LLERIPTGSPFERWVIHVIDELTGVADGLQALSRFFVDEGTLGDTLQEVARLACAVSPAELAGITLLVDGKLATAVFTDPDAPKLMPSVTSRSTGSIPWPERTGGTRAGRPSTTRRRRASQRENRKVRDIASELVDRVAGRHRRG
jgi:hypothetical protein